jgi:predicted S18 family serine protease
LSALFSEVTEFHDEKSEVARSATIEGLVSLQCIGAAQKRVSEAEGYLDDALDALSDGSYITCIYHLAAAMERSKSVGWWLQISDSFNETIEISEETINSLALDYIEDAEQSIIYSDIILGEIGLSSSYLVSADELLASAEADLKKNYPAAALFEALEALIKANLAIENIDDDAEGKIERSKARAGSSIIESTNLGIKPVLAVSYYEYGDSLVNESVFDSALFYFKYSGMIAGALSFTNFSGGESSSRYIGIPEINYPSEGNWFVENIEVIFVILILGGIAGFGLGLIVNELRSGEKKEKKQPVKKPKHPYFSYEEMPRSIKDYYKKNK